MYISLSVLKQIYSMCYSDSSIILYLNLSCHRKLFFMFSYSKTQPFSKVHYIFLLAADTVLCRCTCKCQMLLSISWWVKKCPAVFNPTRSWLAQVLMWENIHLSIFLPSGLSLTLFAEDTDNLPFCAFVKLPSPLMDRWFSIEVAPSHSLIWRPENETPPQDPIKMKALDNRLDIHCLGILCHQHILCHVRIIKSY